MSACILEGGEGDMILGEYWEAVLTRGTRMTPSKQQKMEYLSNRSTKMESDFCV